MKSFLENKQLKLDTLKTFSTCFIVKNNAELHAKERSHMKIHAQCN